MQDLVQFGVKGFGVKDLTFRLQGLGFKVKVSTNCMRFRVGVSSKCWPSLCLTLPEATVS